MRSPFQIFRKYQKESIVILVGMAMFAFVFLDAVSGMQQLPPILWVILLAMMLAGVFWVVGVKVAQKSDKVEKSDVKSKALEYSLAGALLGAAAGAALMMFNREAPAVETTAGNLTQKQVKKMLNDRRMAIEFMSQAYQAGTPQPEGMTMEFQLWDRGLQEATFGFRSSFGEIPIRQEDVIYKYLLLQEAKDYGVRISDESVQAHIARVCKGLTTAAYERIRQKLGLAEDELMDILREELTAQVVVKLKSPQRMTISPPLNYWDQYKKYHVSQRLELAELPVSEFTGRVGEPKDSELRALFDKYKENEPSEVPSPDPAFKLPERIQVACFQPDAEAIRKEIETQLRSEIVPPSERAAELKRIAEDVAAVEKKIKAGEIKKEDVEKERIKAKQRALYRLLKHGEPTRLQYEIVKYYEENKEQEFANSDWAKPHPDELKKKKEGPALKKRGPVEAPRPKRSADKAKPAGKKGTMLPPTRRSLLAAAFASSPAGWTSLLLQPKLEKSKSDKKKADADSKAPKAKKTTEKKPPANPFEDPAPKKDEVTSPAPPPMPVDPISPYLPLDEAAWETAKKSVLDERLSKEIKRRMSAAATAMESERVRYLRALDAKEKFPAAEVSARLASKAKEIGLDYQVTDIVGGVELGSDPSKYPWADAAIVSDFSSPPYMQSEPRRVIYELFPTTSAKSTNRSSQLYQPIKAAEVANVQRLRQFTFTSLKPNELYVLWKTVHLDAEVPKFEDEGVREKVLKAWKEIEASKFARERGEELAKIVRNGRKPMDRLLENETITGKPDGKPLNPRMTPQKFSWQQIVMQNQQSRVPSRSIPQIEQIITSPIPFVPDAGEEFRKTIFEELDDGEVGVVSNAAKTKYYVVRVFDRNPTTQAGLQGAMTNFVKDDNLFTAGRAETSPYFDVNSPGSNINRKLHQEAREALFEKYNVKISQELDER